MTVLRPADTADDAPGHRASLGRWMAVAAVAGVIGAACSSTVIAPTVAPTTAIDTQPPAESRPVDTTAPLSRIALEGLPSKPPALLSISRDSIRPIYEPQFVSASDAGLGDDDLVMGVTIDGDSRAYPIGILTFREMDNDVVGDIPLLVSW